MNEVAAISRAGYECVVRYERHVTVSLFTHYFDSHHPRMYGILLPYLGWCYTIRLPCLLGRVQYRLVNLIGPVLSSTLQPLSHRRVLASPTLFYKYNHGRCSQELSSLLPNQCLSVILTRFSERSHQYAVDISRCKRKFYRTSLFPRTVRFWNPLYRLLSIRIQSLCI